MATITIDESVLTERLIRQAEQVLAADEAKGMHLAADDAEHGEVTYLQEVLEGGFFVYVGQPDALQEHWFGAGSWVAFNDHEGSGHASKVGPDGCKRNFRLLRGRLS
ncbi:MAG: hypothetical protein AB8B91_01205 [Rubripirellula sp.]